MWTDRAADRISRSGTGRSRRCTGYGCARRPRLDDDAALIGRARTGDVAAYETLVRRYQDVAMRTAYLVAPEADAADAVQDGVPQGLRRARPLPGRRAVPAVAAADRGQRGAQSAPVGGPPGRPRAPGRGGDRWRDAVADSPEAEVLAGRGARAAPRRVRAAARRGPRGDRRPLLPRACPRRRRPRRWRSRPGP